MSSKKRTAAGRAQGSLDGFFRKKPKLEDDDVEVVAAPSSVRVPADGKTPEIAEATRPGAGIGTGSAAATTLASASAAVGAAVAAAVVAAAVKKATAAAAAATTPATTPATNPATTPALTTAAAAPAAAAPTPVPTPAPRAALATSSAQPVSQSAAQQARRPIVPPKERGTAAELFKNPKKRVLEGTLSARASRVLDFAAMRTPQVTPAQVTVEKFEGHPGIVVLRRFMDDKKCVELLAAVDDVSRVLPFTIPEVKSPYDGRPAYSNLYMTFAGQVWK
jgi:hypothetical protein